MLWRSTTHIAKYDDSGSTLKILECRPRRRNTVRPQKSRHRSSGGKTVDVIGAEDRERKKEAPRVEPKSKLLNTSKSTLW